MHGEVKDARCGILVYKMYGIIWNEYFIGHLTKNIFFKLLFFKEVKFFMGVLKDSLSPFDIPHVPVEVHCFSAAIFYPPPGHLTSRPHVLRSATHTTPQPPYLYSDYVGDTFFDKT